MKKDYLKIFVAVSACVFMFVSCGGDDDAPSAPVDDVSLYCGNSVSLSGGVYSGMSIENPFIASYSDGSLNGKHVGVTSAILSDGRTFKVTVHSKITTIKDLYLVWNASKSVVLNNSSFGTFESIASDKDYMYYQDKATSILYAYRFESDKLVSASLFVPVKYVSTLASFLTERYYVVSNPDESSDIFSGGFNAYTVEKATTIMGLSVYDSSAYMVVFAPSSSTRSSSVPAESEFAKFYESLGY